MADRNKIYEKKARLYPVIIAMLIPMILFIILGTHICSLFNNFHYIWNVLISIIPAGLITGTLSYSLKSIARSTSKKIFQFPLFKEDETYMPSTNYLLYSTNYMSAQKKQLIREKIKQKIGLDLLNEEQERQNEREARLLIVDAVAQIRERTRGNEILFNYVCYFGFIRNFLGANVWSFLITLIFMIYNFYDSIVSNTISIGAVLLVLSLFGIFYALLKQSGREYARQLYIAFIEI